MLSILVNGSGHWQQEPTGACEKTGHNKNEKTRIILHAR
jgi:hypothetical protein